MTTVPAITAPEQQHEQTEFSPNWDRPLQVAAKRVLDILISALALVLLLPVFVIFGILVRLTSPGPVFYRWKVVGKNGSPFTGYKFRSMVMNADELKSKLEDQNEMAGPVFKITNDPRITPMGGWMRRYSLDELPQLYSVLTGDMSLVGPRPPLVTEYQQFTEYQKQKLAVKPGITCLWQVSGRNDINDFDQWVRLDLEYIRNWSLSYDLQILLRTVGAVFSGSGK
jgi:lipopolysaccharide/colanic/teichoic acid biosynthesis glycosyltransferase